MKNCLLKSEISLDQKLKTKMIMMKNIWKSNLIQMTKFLLIKREIPVLVMVVRAVFHEKNKYYSYVF